MNTMAFAEQFIYLDDQPITFPNRDYLRDIYGFPLRRLVLRASRQVEKTQLVVNRILHLAVTRPGVRIVCAFPRGEQAKDFSRSRLRPTIEESPQLRRVLFGKTGRLPGVKDLRFANGTTVNLRAAFLTADAARGLNADFLFVDEFQDIAAGHLPVLEECLSHSEHRGIVLTGTPKTVDNHLETAFRKSTACEWQVPCATCEGSLLLDEKVLGPRGLVCPACEAPIDPRLGTWVPRNPQATWAAGYWINHLMVPFRNYDDVLSCQQDYPPVAFRNEVLGLPTALGDHVVTREQVEACCEDRPMFRSFKDIRGHQQVRIVAGIDWGGGGTSRTAVVIGVMYRDFHFNVYHFARFDAQEDPDVVLEEVAKLCRRFRVTLVAADGLGNGSVNNRLLWKKLDRQTRYVAVLYSTADKPPEKDGVIYKWAVDRTGSLGVLFGRIKQETLHFPQSTECGPFLDEIACEMTEYDDIQRSVKYVHPPNQQDDTLHALNYALLLAGYVHRQDSSFA